MLAKCSEQEFVSFWGTELGKSLLAIASRDAVITEPDAATTAAREIAGETSKQRDGNNYRLDRSIFLGCLALAMSCNARDGGSTLLEIVQDLRGARVLPLDNRGEHCFNCHVTTALMCYAKNMVS